MKLYKYDKEKLEFKKLKYVPIFLKTIIGVIVFIMFMSLNSTEPIIKKVSHYEDVHVVTYDNTFSEDKLIEEIKKYNFRFPHIVYAQAIHETYKFKSNIFMENHNLFGMKQAIVRMNVAKGTQFGHAYYNNWKESVLDQALWYSTYADKCYTEDQLYQLLDQVYAEDTSYIPKVKGIIKQYNLKQLFENENVEI